jgi:hypothetical protein
MYGVSLSEVTICVNPGEAGWRDEGASEELSIPVVWPEGQDGPRLIQLHRRHLQEVTKVAVDGVDLPDTAWCYSREHSAWPNPFNPRVTVSFTLTAATGVRLDVYDLRGRRLATLVEEDLPAGTHQRTWLQLVR